MITVIDFNKRTIELVPIGEMTMTTKEKRLVKALRLMTAYAEAYKGAYPNNVRQADLEEARHLLQQFQLEKA